MRNAKRQSWLWGLLVASGTALLVAAYLHFTRHPADYTYQGVVLPQTSVNLPLDPPAPAWLLADGKAIPATYGSFSTAHGSADMTQPQQMGNLVTVALPSNPEATILIGSLTIQDPTVTLQAWDTTSTRSLSVGPLSPHERVTSFKTQLQSSDTDQVLQVFVTFSQGWSATYLWRLKAGAAYPTRERVPSSQGYPSPYP